MQIIDVQSASCHILWWTWSHSQFFNVACNSEKLGVAWCMMLGIACIYHNGQAGRYSLATLSQQLHVQYRIPCCHNEHSFLVSASELSSTLNYLPLSIYRAYYISFPPVGMTGTSREHFEYYLHLINRTSCIYTSRSVPDGHLLVCSGILLCGASVYFMFVRVLLQM